METADYPPFLLSPSGLPDGPVCVGALSAATRPLCVSAALTARAGAPLSWAGSAASQHRGRVSFLGVFPDVGKNVPSAWAGSTEHVPRLSLCECVQGSGSGQLGHTLNFICAKPLSDRSAGAERIAHKDLFLKLFTKT